MTQEEIRENLHIQAPVFGIRTEDRNSCILVKRQGVWREPGGANWCALIERDLPAEQKEQVPRV